MTILVLYNNSNDKKINEIVLFINLILFLKLFKYSRKPYYYRRQLDNQFPFAFLYEKCPVSFSSILTSIALIIEFAKKLSFTIRFVILVLLTFLKKDLIAYVPMIYRVKPYRTNEFNGSH